MAELETSTSSPRTSPSSIAQRRTRRGRSPSRCPPVRR